MWFPSYLGWLFCENHCLEGYIVLNIADFTANNDIDYRTVYSI